MRPCWTLRAPALLSAGRRPVRSCPISLFPNPHSWPSETTGEAPGREESGHGNTATGTVLGAGWDPGREHSHQRESRHSVQSAAPQSPAQPHDGQLLRALTTVVLSWAQVTNTQSFKEQYEHHFGSTTNRLLLGRNFINSFK